MPWQASCRARSACCSCAATTRRRRARLHAGRPRDLARRLRADERRAGVHGGHRRRGAQAAGVLGAETGALGESFADGLLEYPQYTRPATFRDMDVPPVLLSGNHAAVAAWRREQSSSAPPACVPTCWTP
ncbi:hypothetical protein [Eggerthella sinensis]|uniref:hypothetical protein n=1 Tax=Eggerthella sinensis TaxID=242230 RepID=UPI0022E555C3|nr:hypothetical protein [Eggerthella sinensis]